MDNVNLYKKITLEIIQCLEKDNKNFKKCMIELGIIDLDKTIKNLLHQNMIKTKLEIQKHKLSTVTNNCYMNNNQQKINIFNAKV